MPKLLSLTLYLSLYLLISCTNNIKSTFAISDFPSELKPFLVRTVSKGIVFFPDSNWRKKVNDRQLERLAKSEHPILRAAAIGEMLRRKSFDHFKIVLEHLDDTALIFVDAGEFGIVDQTVADYALNNVSWKTLEEKSKTIDVVISQHNYLQSAYFILNRIELNDKHYSFVKDMAMRPRRLEPEEGYEMGFNEVEYALYGLAKFKRDGDIHIIKTRLLDKVWRLSDVSLRLMKDFPDTAFFEVLKSYHDRIFYKFSGNRPHGFTGFMADRAAPEDFIHALVAQKSHNSAQLLQEMFDRLSAYECFPDRQVIIDEMIIAIWENPCSAYEELRKKIKSKAERLTQMRMTIPLEKIATMTDTISETYHWYF